MLQLEDTLFFVNDLPGYQSPVRKWNMPYMVPLCDLFHLLGPGSQAAIFLDYNLGDRHSSQRDDDWERAFGEFIAETWPQGAPAILVERGYSRGQYGASHTRDRLFGRDILSQVDDKDLAPTPLRIYTPSFWRQEETERPAADLCRGVLLTLTERSSALEVARGGNLPGRPRSQDWLSRWLLTCSVTSQHYQRLAVVEWEDHVPVVASQIDLMAQLGHV